MRKNLPWLIGIAALFLLCAAIALRQYAGAKTGTAVQVYSDGTLLREIDLSAVSEPYEFSVTGTHGVNRVRVEPGRICVSEADCPDGLCVRSGWLKNSPLVCLPNGLVICLSGGGDVDSVTR